MNSGEITQEYDQHLGPVNTITFVDENRRFVTTSDDKTIRAWDFDIPVVIKYIAEPHMHSMPAVTIHPNSKCCVAEVCHEIYPFPMRQRNISRRSHSITRSSCTARTTSGRHATSGSPDTLSLGTHARWASRPTVSGSAAETARGTLCSGSGRPAASSLGCARTRRWSLRTSGCRTRRYVASVPWRIRGVLILILFPTVEGHHCVLGWADQVMGACFLTCSDNFGS